MAPLMDAEFVTSAIAGPPSLGGFGLWCGLLTEARPNVREAGDGRAGRAVTTEPLRLGKPFKEPFAGFESCGRLLVEFPVPRWLRFVAGCWG